MAEMSEENVDAVRAMFDQAAIGDFSALADTSDEFEFVTSPEVPDAGTYRGDAAREWVRAWIASFDELTMAATELIGAGEDVFVEILQRGRPRGSEAPVEGRWWGIYTFRDGELARIQIFPERAQALEAAGLSA
jgi:ketosteroid isomerase-like protein